MSEINLDDSMADILDEIETGVKKDDPVDDDVKIDDAELEAIVDDTATDDEEEAEEVTAQAPEPVVAPEPSEELEPRLNLPPTTWTAEAKSKYSALPSWAKKEVHKREEDVLRGITNLKQQGEFATRIEKTIAPYQAMLSSKGVQPEQAVSAMLNTLYTLETASPQQKAQLIRDLATRYNADMSVLSSAPDPKQAELSRYIAPLEQQVRQLQQVIQSQQQSGQQAAINQANAEIEEFATALDESGKAKHPYFSNVSDIMVSFIESGRATTLKDAYDLATWSDPSVRALLLSEQTKQMEAKRKEDDRKRLEKSKKANKPNIERRGSHETTKGKPVGSVVDTLNDTFDALMAS